MKKLTKILVIPLLVLSLVGCGKIPVLENGQEAVLTTENGSISAEELYQKLKTSYSKYIIADMIDRIIFDTDEKQSDEEKDYIEDYIDNISESVSQQGYTAESYIKANYGMSMDEFRDALSLNYKREQAINKEIEKDLTDKEIEKYYEENIYGDIKVKHILISPETLDGMTSEEIAEKKDEALKDAKDIIKKLNNGEEFDELAKKYSDDSSNASKGGDLGWFNTGKMLEEFEQAAFALKKGEYTKTPVETSYGYHIIYKTDAKDKPSLEDSKTTIKDALVKQKLAEDATLFYDTLEKLRKNNKLEIVDSELKDIYNDYLNSLIQSASANSN